MSEPVPAALPGGRPPPPGSPVTDWLTDGTVQSRTVVGLVPRRYAAYATVLVPDGDAARTRADAALVEALLAHPPAPPWHLGYLDTGAADVVEPGAPRVSVYGGWTYVLLEGGPEQALGARRNADATPWHSALPELVFPRDRSWLVATPWDDPWRLVGGPATLVEALVRSPDLDAQEVGPDEELTPPG